MQELIARLGVIFSQLGDRSGPRWKTRTPARRWAPAIDVILPVACGILRVVAVIVAIVIIVRCLMSLFREKPGKEIWGWLTLGDGTRLDLCHWENAIGRGDGRMSVWIFPPSPAPCGPAAGRQGELETPAPADQERNPAQRKESHPHRAGEDRGTFIDLGGIGLSFYAISEKEEREQAMRWGVAERPEPPAEPWDT